jgi:adenylate cyclase
MKPARGPASNTTRRVSQQAAGIRERTGVVGRKLVTIVHLDIVGYTQLVAADDAGTLERIRELRTRLVEPALARWGGQLKQTAGDALLMTFDSILGAVEFAIETQRLVGELKLAIRTGHALIARVGIEISDTLADATDLHGDGVIAAVRLQSACPPGGLCISSTVHDHVEGRIDFRFKALGALKLKNLKRPMEAYCLTAEELGRKSGSTFAGEYGSTHAERAATVVGLRSTDSFGIPPRNSIAVLPFVGIGNDPVQEYFADGVVDDVITELSHFQHLFVIARSSSFSYKNRNVDLREIGRQLGVDYIVEGSIRRINDRVRLSPRLGFASTGAQLWAERFDSELTDIFALQDAVSQHIAVSIEPQIRATELARARRKPVEDLDSYDYYLRAQPHMESFSGEGIRAALPLLLKSVRLDPTCAPAIAAAAACYLGLHDQGWSTVDDNAKQEGLRLADTALKYGAGDATVLCLVGHTIAGLTADYYGAAELLDRALQINPNYAQAWMRSGMVRVYLDDPKTAIHHADRALSLSPRDARLFLPLCAKGYANLLLGDYEAAVQVAKRTLTLMTKPEMAYRILITALWQLGRKDEMLAVAAALLKQIPTFTVSEWRSRVAFTKDKRFDMMAIALRDAGLPQ